MMKRFAIPLVMILVLVAAACGGGDGGGGGVDVDEASPTADAATGATGATAGAETGTTGTTGSGDEATAGGEVPDPCSLIPAEELGAILGSDPGVGTVQAVVPDQRKICLYDTGLILAVEVAENWEASIAFLRDSGTGTVTEVSGIGEAAIWQDVGGGVGQLLALGPDYFVGVTVATGGQSASEEVVQIMLEAL